MKNETETSAAVQSRFPEERRAEEASLYEETLSTERLYDGAVVHLERSRVRLPNGHESVREVVRHVGAVCMLPLLENGDVLMERQFRYPHARVLWEIPAGKLNFKGEDFLAAAKRELYEETGCTADTWTPIGRLYTTPAFVDEVIEMYLAEGLRSADGQQHLDADEFLTVKKIHIETLCDMVMRGEIADAKTQVAVLKVKRILDERKK